MLSDKHDELPGFFRQLDAFFIGNGLSNRLIPVGRFQQITFGVYLYGLIIHFKIIV
jgi:hypothetical protein